MDTVIQIADLFSRRNLQNRSNPNDLIEAAQTELSRIFDKLDKIKFLQYVLEKNRESYEQHLKECRHGANCVTSSNHQKIDYYLNQELKSQGLDSSEDSYNTSEKESFNFKIDKILNDLETLKDGQQIIYEDLCEQMNELKDFYFLGKRKWTQLLIGKAVEMTISGIISETISKELISSLTNISPNLSIK